MGSRSEAVGSFENRVKHMKRGERRIAETERHVECLCEKLCCLERMLPQDVPRGACFDKDCPGGYVSSDSACPVDELGKNEKSLRKQIHNMECTEQAYVRQIAENTTRQVEKKSRYREAIARERLSLLENYSQKLCHNLRSLSNNHTGLSEVLEATRKCCSERHQDQQQQSCPQYQASSILQEGTCGSSTSAKCDCCTICSCDEWERDSKALSLTSDRSIHTWNTRRKKADNNKIIRHWQSCSPSVSESESCQCHRRSIGAIMHTHNNEIKSCACKIQSDIQSSMSSDCSNSEESNSCYSDDKSKYTCCCSKNQSHEDLTGDLRDGKTRQAGERCRGGLDTIEATATTVVSLNQNDVFPSASRNVIDRFKPLKIEDVCEGLERLKIRNRNLKDFIQTLEQPITLIDKSCETASFSTDFPSCYTLDLASQTQSGLLTVIDVLETKCRSKDAVIVALADELKNRNDKKMAFRLRREPSNEKLDIWKRYSKGINDAAAAKIFMKDFAIGFLIFLLILTYHIKQFEIISYYLAAKNIITEIPFKPALYVNKIEKLWVDRVTVPFEKIVTTSTRKLIHNASVRWKNTSLPSFSHAFRSFFLLFHFYLHEHLNFMRSYQFYFVLGFSILFLGFLLFKFKKPIKNDIEKFNFKQFKFLLDSLKSALTTRFLIFTKFTCQNVTSWKLVWLTLGFFTHVFWILVKDDLFKSMNLINMYFFNTSSILESRGENLTEANVSNEPNYYHFIIAFTAKLQSIIDFSRYLLENFIR